ncbi:tape measure protein [Phyllobacterium meliloti]|uniref:tape measure protein n=1 Tax=Phyllobacterium meliloti TaxID=555317 RepID=UPI001D13FF15|nr:tape measure protein [Phyllobacterium sp. T1293]UGX87126.1 tape measure protein [Phyllobacterium sp. T1293]
MARDLETLVVQLSADIKKYENALNKANGLTNRQMNSIEGRVRKSSKNIASSLSGLGGVVAGAFAGGVALKGAQDLLDASTRITNALKVAGLSGNDLKTVYDALFVSAQKNAAPLESLVTLYGRVSLVQKELNINQQQLIGFTDKVALALRVAGTDASTASGALLQLSQALGSGTVRAEEFNSVQEGALPILQAVAAGMKEAGGSVSKLRALVIDGKVSSEAFFKAFEAGSPILEEKVAGSTLTVSQGFTRLGNIMINVAREFDNSTDAAMLITKFLKELGDVFQQLGGWITAATGPLAEFAGYLDTVSASAQQTGAAIGKFLGTDKVGQFFGATGPKPTDKQIQDRINTAFGTSAKPGTTADITGGGTLRPNAIKPISIEDYKPVGKPKKAKAVPKTADDRITADIQQVKDRTEALRLEAEMVGKSYQAQEARKMALDLEQSALADLREEARKKGVTDLDSIKLSSEQVAKINAVSEAYGRQAEELRKVQETQERAESAASEFYDTFKSGVIGAITGAESLKDALSGILKKLAEMLLNSAFDQLFKPASGNSAGGMFGGIFGSIGKLLGFDKGGYTGAGGKNDPAGIVHKGEYVIPKSIVDKVGVGGIHSMLGGYAGGGLVGRAPNMPRLHSQSSRSQPVSVVYSPSIDARGADAAAVTRLEQAMARDRQELPAHIVTTVRKAQKSRVLS